MECLEWHTHLAAANCPQSGILTCCTLYVVLVSDHHYVASSQVAGEFYSFQSACSFLLLFLAVDRREDFFVIFSQSVHFVETILTHHDRVGFKT